MKYFSQSIKTFLYLILGISLSGAVEGPRCADAFSKAESPTSNQYGIKKRLIKLGDFEIPVSVVTKTEPTGKYNADQILPELDENRRVIVGFSKGHTYISYRGIVLDSSGLVGYRVISKMRAPKRVYGDFLFVLHDLPDASLEGLNRNFESFKKSSKLSCVMHTCWFLNQFDTQLLENKSYFRASKLFSRLLDVAASGSTQIEIVALNPDTDRAERAMYEFEAKNNLRFISVGIGLSPFFMGGIDLILKHIR